MAVSNINLAEHGPELSRFVAGMWRLMEWSMSTEQGVAFVESLLELGVTTFDHADIYGNGECETVFGQWLSAAPSLRERMQIVSKCGIKLRHGPFNGPYDINYYDSSAKHIVWSVEQSLKRLNTDRLDVLLLHRPDYLFDAGEVAEAFEQLKRDGKVRHFGVSNFNVNQFELLNSVTPLVTNQLEISPFNLSLLDSGELDQCQRLKIKPMAWSCLGGGRLFNDSEFDALRVVLKQIANEVGAPSIEQVVFAWVLSLPCQPLPIMGSGNLSRIKLAVEAQHIVLNREQWYAIWQAVTGHSVP